MRNYRSVQCTEAGIDGLKKDALLRTVFRNSCGHDIADFKLLLGESYWKVPFFD